MACLPSCWSYGRNQKPICSLGTSLGSVPHRDQMRGMYWSGKYEPVAPEITSEGAARIKALATSLVRDVLREYDETGMNELDPKHWKVIERRKTLTAYKERYPSREAITTDEDSQLSSDSSTSTNQWSLPKAIIGLGEVDGTVDDVMLGMTSPSMQKMLLKNAYMKANVADSRVLKIIEAPTPERPYHLLALKWFLSAPAGKFTKIAKLRDVLALDSTGIIERKNGERIGYQLFHSLDFPECSNEDKGILRMRSSTCYLFKQEGSKVSVYIKGYVEDFGQLLTTVMLRVMARTFLVSWNAVMIANHKKLDYLIQQQQEEGNKRQGDDGLASDGNVEVISGACGTCFKAGGLITKLVTCNLCETPLCSACRKCDTHYRIVRGNKLQKSTSTTCGPCMDKVCNYSAFVVARHEVMEDDISEPWEAETVSRTSETKSDASAYKTDQSISSSDSVSAADMSEWEVEPPEFVNEDAADVGSWRDLGSYTPEDFSATSQLREYAWHEMTKRRVAATGSAIQLSPVGAESK